MTQHQLDESIWQKYPRTCPVAACNDHDKFRPFGITLWHLKNPSHFLILLFTGEVDYPMIFQCCLLNPFRWRWLKPPPSTALITPIFLPWNEHFKYLQGFQIQRCFYSEAWNFCFINLEPKWGPLVLEGKISPKNRGQTHRFPGTSGTFVRFFQGFWGKVGG